MIDDPNGPESRPRPAIWRIILAAILDFFTAFLVGGYLVGKLTGQTTENGFHLTGLAALGCFMVIVCYFILGRNYLGGTIWQRILKAR